MSLKHAVVLTALIAAPVGWAGRAQAAQPKPNVVLLFIDDLGYGDTGPFGCKDIPTPNIDRLAREGTTFTQAYVSNPPCCPSRASLMMGMYGQHFGKYGMSRGLPIPNDKPTMGEFLRDNGYVTGQVGKWDIGSKLQGPASRGFMEVAEDPPRVEKGGKEARFLYKTKEGKTDWLTNYDGDNLVEFMDRHRTKDKPFFMYWSPMAVHSPHKNVPEELAARTTAPKERRQLGGGIVSVDDQVGKMLAYLDKHKMRENTLIIFSSDNGGNPKEGSYSTPYRGGKGGGTQQVGWTLSPTIMSWPGKIPQDERFHELSCTLDFYATVAAAAGLPAPKHLDGVDLVPYLAGKKQGAPHEYLFWLNNDPDDSKRRHLVAVRWKTWRLYRFQEKDPWQLFNLKKDPREEKDVAAKNPEIVEQLAAAHTEWKKGHATPLKPSTAKVKNPVPTGHGWFISDGRVKAEVVPGKERQRKSKSKKNKQSEKK